MKYHSTYMGINIYRNTEPGSKLRWTTVAVFAADTLVGIKQLIKEWRMKEKSNV